VTGIHNIIKRDKTRLWPRLFGSHSSSMRKFNPPPALLRCRVLLKTKTTGLGVSPRKGERGRSLRNSTSCGAQILIVVGMGGPVHLHLPSLVGGDKNADCIGSKPSAKSRRNSSYEIRIPRASQAKAKDVADSSKSLDTSKSSVSSKSVC
jgi:hypothetical protein